MHMKKTLKVNFMQLSDLQPVIAQVRCMRRVLRCALGTPRGMGWGGRWERGSGWGIHVNPWLIHGNVWQKPLQYCKVISLQLINEKKKRIKLYFVPPPKKIFMVQCIFDDFSDAK